MFQVPVLVKSEVKTRTLSPVWKAFELSLIKFCGGQDNTQVTVDVFDWDRIGDPDLIGSCIITMAALHRGTREFPLVNPRSVPLPIGGSQTTTRS